MPNYTDDWFSGHIPVWKEMLKDMFGKSNLTYLEIGVYQGRSLVWMLENVLTHDTSKAIAIDTFKGSIYWIKQGFSCATAEELFMENTRPYTNKITLIKELSRNALKRVNTCVDIAYIDGDHRARNVLCDACAVWDLIPVGGIMIFDDYPWRSKIPGFKDDGPKEGIDVFLAVFGQELEVLAKTNQVIVKKTRIHED